MSAPTLNIGYNEFLDYLVHIADPAQILAFKLSEEAQMRADELTERNKLSLLSQDEKAELDQMIEFDLTVSVLKAKAAKVLRKRE